MCGTALALGACDKNDEATNDAATDINVAMDNTPDLNMTAEPRLRR